MNPFEFLQNYLKENVFYSPEVIEQINNKSRQRASFKSRREGLDNVYPDRFSEAPEEKSQDERTSRRGSGVRGRGPEKAISLSPKAIRGRSGAKREVGETVIVPIVEEPKIVPTSALANLPESANVPSQFPEGIIIGDEIEAKPDPTPVVTEAKTDLSKPVDFNPYDATIATGVDYEKYIPGYRENPLTAGSMKGDHKFINPREKAIMARKELTERSRERKAAEKFTDEVFNKPSTLDENDIKNLDLGLQYPDLIKGDFKGIF